MMRDGVGPAPPPIAATVVIPLHNHESYIGDLLESLFEQWRPEFELLLIDDHSADEGFRKVNDILARYSRIRATVMRTETVEGMKLVQRILELARGTILIRADSDDVAMPGRLDAIMACFELDRDCRLVTTNAMMIAPDSRPCGIYDTTSAAAVLRDPLAAAGILGDRRWLGATIAYHRDVYERFPPLDPELCPYGLDLLLPFRAVLLGSHHYLAEPLVGWRLHGANTHRMAGHYDTSDAAQERYHGLLMMVLAQKVRDAEVMATQRPSAVLDDTVKACRSRFNEKFDQWCRLRTRVMRPDDGHQMPAGQSFRPAAPPVPTLAPGETLRFQTGTFGSKILAHYAGFHGSEVWGTWTERVAFLSLRILSAPAAAMRLDLELRAPGLASRQRIAVRVGLHDWTEVEVGAGTDWTMRLPCPLVCDATVVDLVVVARDAVEPVKVNAASVDERVIGIGLLAITAVAIERGRDTERDHGTEHPRRGRNGMAAPWLPLRRRWRDLVR